MRILVVEDEPKIAGFLLRGLDEEGHRVDVVADLAAARLAVRVERYDLLLVDRMLPDGDGLAVVRELRRARDRTPAICLTARDRVEERVEGLYSGADDYLVKPFEFEELLARIAAVTRRGVGAERLEVGDLVVDVEAHRVTRAGAELTLTAQEFALLRYFAENAGRVLSRTRLLDAVWATTHDPRTNVVDVYVSYLRAKIDKGFPQPLLHTVRGAGYVLEDRAR
ncbi:MAG: DNA-binding response regulator [Deltaproteobacteria bacterium HGW-Deltaproteobacteria-14]|jgi:DNA-binding response OmpR family regulator|nr:MAG: DNA-binding response regulator [Deltaproteobacteria bacterium HGW-Deltaproteobacteria-14]